MSRPPCPGRPPPQMPWEIQAHLKRQGTPIGELDTQIAVYALVEDLILITHNTRHFDKVPGFRFEDWMA